MADNIQTNIQIQADTKQALEKIRELNQAISTFNRSVNQQNADAMKTAKALEKQVLGTNFANNFNTQIIRMSSSVEQFSQKLDKGKASFQDYRKLLDRENGMLEQVAQRRVKLMQSMQIALTGQIRGGQRGALVTPREFDNLATSTANVQAFGKQMDISTQKTILLNEALRQGAIQLTNWGKNMQWAGRQLTVGLTLPITAFSAVAVSSFKDVEEQLIQIRRVYGDLETTDYEKALGEQQLTEAAEAWTKYGVSVSDALKVGAQVAATGATGAEAVSQMNEAIRFATLGNFELADSQQAVIAMMSSMGIASEDLRGEIDYLNAVENQTLLTMQDVADAVPRVGPVLKDMGGDVRDLTALLAAMKEGGVDASEGANALKSGLASLINPTKEAQEAFSEFGIDINSIVQQGAGDPVAMIQNLGASIEGLSKLGQQRLIESLFGKYQFARWSALFDNINKAGSQAQETLELAGMSAEELAQIANSELAKIEESPLTKFNKNLEELKMALVPIGEMVLRVFNPLLDVLGHLVDFVGENDVAKWIAGIGGAVIAIVGPITMIAGLFANFIGNILQFRAFLRKRATGETFMTELEIQGKLAAAALDEFGREAQQNLAVLNAQSTAVRDLASEYNILAASVERAKIEIAQTANDPTRSRAGVNTAGQQAAQYRYRRRFATGGTVPGTGSGDKVPAMLEPGEFVVSKDAAQKFRPTLDAMNAGTVQGMQGGTSARGLSKTALIKELQNIYKYSAEAAREAVEVLHKELDRGTKAFTISQTRVIRDVAEQGEMAGEAFAKSFFEKQKKVGRTELTHLTKDETESLAEFRKRSGISAVASRDARALSDLFGVENISAKLFGKSALPAGLDINQALKVRFNKQGEQIGGISSELYKRDILGRSSERSVELNKQLKSIDSNFVSTTKSMQQFDILIADEAQKIAGAGKKITDADIDEAIVRVANGSAQASSEMNTFAKEIFDLGKAIQKVEFQIDKKELQKFREKYGANAVAGGPPVPFTTPKGYSGTVQRTQAGKLQLGPITNAAGETVYTSEMPRVGGSGKARTRQTRHPVPNAGEMKRTVRKVSDSVTDTMEQELETQSPSKKTKKIGNDIVQGLIIGMESEIPELKLMAEQVSKAAMTPLSSLNVHPAYVRQYGVAQAERERRVQASREVLSVQPIVGQPTTQSQVRVGRMPNLATQTEQLADANEHGITAAKAASDANAKVAREAEEAAGDLNKVSKSSEQLHGSGGGFSKTLFGLDALSGALLFTEGSLGKFANSLFIASSALTALDIFTGGGVGKAGSKISGGLLSLVGGAGGRFATGLTAALPVLGGVAAAAAAVAGTFYLVNKEMNKFDEALGNTSDALKAAAEKLGYELKLPQARAPGTEYIKAGEQISETQKLIAELVDQELAPQVKYIQQIEDTGARGSMIKSIVAEFIASGMPAEYAQELARQLAKETGAKLTDFIEKIPTLYNPETKQLQTAAEGGTAGEQLTTDILQAFREAQKENLPKDTFFDSAERFVDSINNAILPDSWEDNRVVDFFTKGPLEHVSELFGGPRETTANLEPLVNSMMVNTEALANLYSQGTISTEKYFDSLDEMVKVQRQYGKEAGFLTDKFIEQNPQLDYLKDELNKVGTQAQLTALQFANVDIGPIIQALEQASAAGELDTDAGIKEFQDFVDRYMAGAEAILKVQEGLLATPKANIRKEELFIAGKEKEQIDLDEKITKEQQALDLIDAQNASAFDSYKERQYQIDRANYGLELQVDAKQELIDLEQEEIDKIDEKIDKIEEARDAEKDAVNEVADAQIANLERLQQAAERGQQERSAFFDIGRALQEGDISAAMRAQESYTQEFGQDTYQDQIDQIENWRDARIDAIDEAAQAEIDAQEKIRKSHEETQKTYQQQLDDIQEIIDANNKESRAIDEKTAILEHNIELQKKGHEDAIKHFRETQAQNAKDIGDAQTKIKLEQDKINVILKQSDQVMAGLKQFATTYMLKPEDISSILKGEKLEKYMSGTDMAKLEFTGTGGKVYTLTPKKHTGGMITGADKTSAVQGLAHDEVPAVLQTGEFVMQRSAVNKIGQATLEAINKQPYIPKQHELELNSTAYEKYHSGGAVGLNSAFGSAINTLLSDRINQQMFQTIGLSAAVAANQKEQEFNVMGPLPDVDWSKVSGGAGGGWFWPAPGYAQNSDDFGYIGGRTYSDGRPRRHAGWDIGMPNGGIVHAIRAGTVVRSGRSSSAAGQWMAVDHGGGLFTRYLHLQKPLRNIGDYVNAGSPIARSDSTGTSVPHLHFEITKNRDYSEYADAFNPLRWFKLHTPYNYHEGGIVGTNEVPAILEKGEFVIPKDGWTYGEQSMSMPSYGAPTGGNNFSMPTYASSNSSVAPVAVGGGGGSGGGSSSSYSNNASNAYTINVNVNGANASANEIANTVYARINRTQRISRR